MGSQTTATESAAKKTPSKTGPGGQEKSPQDAAQAGETRPFRAVSPPPPPPTATAATTIEARQTDGANLSDKQLLDAECERLLRNTKRQVKQMMEEAVTKKFIHEESSSIISLCVSIDACLSHQLKRRALGLFKTNSSTALVRKIAKLCPEAQSTISMVEEEERRQQEELKRQKKQQSAAAQLQQQQQASDGSARGATGPLTKPATNLRSPAKQVASNLSVHKRNMWIKCALIEKKLVPIVEHLAANASKYYEPEALMANCVSAQLLCSLLVGPCALEFSRSKTNDFYQFEEPSADELLKRHKLSNPIACLCSSSSHPWPTQRSQGDSLNYSRSSVQHYDDRHRVSRSLSTSTGGGGAKPNSCQDQRRPEATNGSSQQHLGLSANNDEAAPRSPEATRPAARPSQRRPSTISQSSLNSFIREEENNNPRQASSPSLVSGSPLVRNSSGGSATNGGNSGRRRPLSLRTNIKTGVLVTECHHSACQEISSHRQTLGYSFTSAPNSNNKQLPAQVCRASSKGPTLGQRHESQGGATSGAADQTRQSVSYSASAQSQLNCNLQDANWSAWSPRMLHETLHQNSKSSLLYAKNNVLLETNAHGNIAGYLSLHQTSSSDLILKWIPNQLINGGHTQTIGSETACSCEHQAVGKEAPPRRQAQSISDTIEEDAETQMRGVNSIRRPSNRSASSNEVRHTPRWTPEGEVRSQSLSASDGLQQPQRRRRADCSCQDLVIERAAAGPEQQHQDLSQVTGSSRAIGSSYLDLVISLSVSRIVLLHCHFNGTPTSEFFTSANEQFSPNGATESESESGARLDGDMEETLVLVEADGVQRAPFRFPKGGLRWFLSCLENGLGPDRYLEPAIRPDEDDNNNGENRRPGDPLQMLNSLGWASNGWNHMAATSGADSPSTASEPAGATSSGNSRLEVLLRRLPSLRRAQAAPTAANDKSRSAEITSATGTAPGATDGSQPGSRRGSKTLSPQTNSANNFEQPATTNGQLKRHQRSVNYVYRIVSAHQLDWPQQTPPLSAFSADSSSSSSFLTVGINGVFYKQRRQRQPLSSESSGVGQRFSWSLSKLTRFSSRNNSTSSSPAAAAGGAAPHNDLTVGHQSKSTTLGSLTSLLYLSYNKTTLDSAGSLDSNQQMSDPNDSNNNTINDSLMKRDSSSELIRIEAKLNDLKKSSTEELALLRNQSIQTLCESMRKQILARAFYGWLVYCRRMKIVRTHLMGLINESRLVEKRSEDRSGKEEADDQEAARQSGLTWERWRGLQAPTSTSTKQELANRVNRLVYYGGIEDDQLRAEVWPYLLGHYEFGDSPEVRRRRDAASRGAFESSACDWIKIERVIKERDSEILAANMAKVARRQQRERLMATGELGQDQTHGFSSLTSDTTDQDSADLLREDDDEAGTQPDDHEDEEDEQEEEQPQEREIDNDARDDGVARSELPTCSETIGETDGKDDATKDKIEHKKDRQASNKGSLKAAAKARAKRQRRMRRRFRLESTGSVGSDASITDQFGNNIHRIDKDVQRCDRNFWYFKKTENLNKLRKIMCSYVWQHLDVGYVQGMCDLAAPILVIFDHDELMAFNCFSQLMKRMVANFPHGSAMDQHFEHLKYLMQVLDPKLFEILQNNGDYTHFYFCYRWLLLDFKRELAYDDVYRVWEAIWSARVVATEHFVVFLALAMVRYYRDIIIENNMDFTDTIKFFNEMAERHDAKKIIALAQDCVTELESLIEA